MDKNNDDFFKEEDTKEINFENDKLSKLEFERLNNKIDIQFDKLNQNIANTNKLMHWVIIVFGLVSVGLIIYIFTLLFVK